MEGGKEALEEFAREAVALYGRAAPKMLLRRAEIADLYGDALAATWREAAAIASRITRRIDDRQTVASTTAAVARTKPDREPNHVLRKKRGHR